jgi:HTH-type transcriptional regulator/antitoxin HigA
MTTTVKIAPVRTEADYEKAKVRISTLLPRTDESSLDELDILSTLVEQYEKRLYALDGPTPLSAIRFRMNQAELKARDLEPFIGGRSRVSEVLSGKRPLSLDMIRALHRNLGIPLQSLIGGDVVEITTDLREPSGAALQMLRDRKFIRSNESFASYLDRAFGVGEVAACWRKSRTERTSAKTDHAALSGWLAAVRILADQIEIAKARRPSPEALGRRIAKLSVQPDGPQLAKAELARLGIILITLEHLPGTYLDGRAPL